MSGWWDTMQRQAMTDSDLPGVVNPQRLVWELSEQLPANAMVASDSGSSANWYARDLRFRGDVRGSLSGTLATMGPGVPYVIGAKFAHPDRPAIAIVGDGAMQMNGMAELMTIGRYWQEWSDPRLIVAVLHNNDLNQVTWEMRAMEGAPKFVESQALPDYSYADVRHHGRPERRSRSPKLTRWPVPGAEPWRRTARRCSTCTPTPNVPPIPPHATFEQMKSAGLAMLARRRGRPPGHHDGRQAENAGVPAWPEGPVMRSLTRAAAAKTVVPPAVGGLAVRALRDVRTGRFERTLGRAGRGAGAVITTGEIFTVPRQRQLRQQDDVVADRDRADPGPGGSRGRVQPASRQDGAAAGIAAGGGQRDPGHVPPLARDQPQTGRLDATSATTSRWGPRRSRLPWPAWWAAWGCWPRCCAGRGTECRSVRPNAKAVTPGGKGRFPGFDVLDEVDRWDDVTAGVVLARLDPQPEVSFFTATEQATAAALFDQLLGQDGEPKVPVLLLVDRRLALGQTDGWHYEDMPEDGDAWRLTLAALDDDARDGRRQPLPPLDLEQQGALVQAVHDAETGTGCPVPCVEPVDPLRLRRLLLPPVGVERDRFRRPRLPPGLQGARDRTSGKDGRSPTITASTRSPSPSGSSEPNAATRTSPASLARNRRRSEAVTRFSDTTIRARNESAWLLPAGDDRTNHRLRADMRRFDDNDEVDMVIVGCGAGGATLMQRLARAGWRVVGARRRPVLGSRRRLGQRRGGLAPAVLDRTTGHHRRRPGPAWAPTTPDGGSAARWSTTPATPPASTPRTFATATLDGVGADWPIAYQDLRPYYEAIEEELPVSGQDWPWGDPHSYPYYAQPVGGNGEIFLRGAAALGIEARVGPVAIANGRFGNRPHCIYRGFCLQGCKVNAKASPLITHVPDALAHGAEIRANCMVTRVVARRRGAGHRRHLLHRRRRALPAGPDGGGRRLLHRDAPPAAALRQQPLPRRAVQRPRPGRPLPHGAGRAADGRALRRGGPHVQGPAARGVSSEQFYETDPTKDYRRGFSIQNVSPLPITYAEHVAAQGHWGEVLREYMRDYVHWADPGRPLRVPAPLRQRGHPGRTRRTATGCPSPTSPTASATTTEQAGGGGPTGHGRHPPSRRRRRGHDHRPLRPSGRRLPHGCRRPKTAWSTPTCGPSPSPTCTSPTAACCPPRARPTRR